MSLPLSAHEIAHGQGHGCFIASCGGQLSSAGQAVLAGMFASDLIAGLQLSQATSSPMQNVGTGQQQGGPDVNLR